VRVFLAVPADPPWVESARELVTRLKPTLPRASWTRPEAWHLTLAFLGEIDAKTTDDFAAAMSPSFPAAAGGELTETVAVLFPPRGRPRVLGIGFQGSAVLESLRRLADAAGAAARVLGIPFRNRAFHPHVTLARVRDPWPKEPVEKFRTEAQAWPFPPWLVRSCVLYGSRLDPAGAVHTPLRQWELGVRHPEVGA
jgi:2'-5' RNA ligase